MMRMEGKCAKFFVLALTEKYHLIIYFRQSLISDQETAAEDLVERGEIDQAIAIYQQMEGKSAREFRAMGVLYANEKGNYEFAISCYEQALQLQEQVCP